MSKSLFVSYLRESSLPVASSVHISTYPLMKGGSLSSNKTIEADHSSKWQDCVHDVKGKGSSDNPYAVCTTSIGHQSSEGGAGSGRKKSGSSSKSSPLKKALNYFKGFFRGSKKSSDDSDANWLDSHTSEPSYAYDRGSHSTSEGGPGSGRYPSGSGEHPQGAVLSASPSGGTIAQTKPGTLYSYKYVGNQYKAGVRYPKSDNRSALMHNSNREKESDQSSSFPQNMRGKSK